MVYDVIEENVAEKMFREANKPPSKIMKILTESGLVAKEESPNWIYFLVALVLFVIIRLFTSSVDLLAFLLGFWFSRLVHRKEPIQKFPPLVRSLPPKFPLPPKVEEEAKIGNTKPTATS